MWRAKWARKTGMDLRNCDVSFFGRAAGVLEAPSGRQATPRLCELFGKMFRWIRVLPRTAHQRSYYPAEVILVRVAHHQRVLSSCFEITSDVSALLGGIDPDWLFHPTLPSWIQHKDTACLLLNICLSDAVLKWHFYSYYHFNNFDFLPEIRGWTVSTPWALLTSVKCVNCTVLAPGMIAQYVKSQILLHELWLQMCHREDELKGEKVGWWRHLRCNSPKLL